MKWGWRVVRRRQDLFIYPLPHLPVYSQQSDQILEPFGLHGVSTVERLFGRKISLLHFEFSGEA